MAGPEKALEPIFLSARYNVDVKMRNALADMVVDGDKGPLGLHSDFYGMGEELGIRKQGSDEIGGKIDQRLAMIFRDQKTMAGKEGPVIQKGQGQVVLKYYNRLQLFPDDSAKFACIVHDMSVKGQNIPRRHEEEK
jgi:hypothetical protein